MSDSFTEFSTQSFFSRITNSLTSLLFGLLLLIAAIFLTYWNEGNAVSTEKLLDEGANTVVSIAATQNDSALSGKLVHLSGIAQSSQTLMDPDFGISAPNAIRLRRKVEMYQWKENVTSRTEKQLGGSTQTIKTYNYTQEWTTQLLQSGAFKNPVEHRNPAQFPIPPKEQNSTAVQVGAFTLSPGLISQMNQFQPLLLTENSPSSSMLGHATPIKINDNTLFIGTNPNTPNVGDLRLSFEIIQPSQVTLIARHAGNRLEAFTSPTGGQIEILAPGILSADAVFTKQNQANHTLTWALRVGAFLLFFAAYTCLFNPLVILADVIPVVGSWVQYGAGSIAKILAILSFTLVFFISWFRFRPVLAGLVVAAGLIWIGWLRSRRQRSSKKPGSV